MNHEVLLIDIGTDIWTAIAFAWQPPESALMAVRRRLDLPLLFRGLLSSTGAELFSVRKLKFEVNFERYSFLSHCFDASSRFIGVLSADLINMYIKN